MTIELAKYEYGNEAVRVVFNGTTYSVPVNQENRHYKELMEWVAEGNTIEPADPLPPPPTNQELVDVAGPVLVAFIKAYAKRENLTLAQVRDAIVAEM